MVNKKFSDFESTNIVLEDEILPTQLANEKNRKITFNDLFNQFKSKLTNEATTDAGVVKFMYAEHASGVPLNLPKHLVWCDGRTLVRADNQGLIGLYIDSIYDKPTLRSQFQIPADKSSMKLPDLRNKHIVGSGTLNPIYTDISSKSIDFITNISASSSTNVNNKTGLWTNNGGSHQHSLTQRRVSGSPVTLLAGGPNEWVIGGDASRVLGYTEWVGDHSHYVPDHNHTASTSTSVSMTKNTALIDSVNRVPAFALFPVLDINVYGLTLDPDNSGSLVINITDVVGLTEALNTKVDLTTFNTAVVDTSSKFERYSSFGIKYVKSGLNLVINSSPTSLTNITNLIKTPTSLVSWATDNKGDDKTTISLVDVLNGFKFPVIVGMTNYNVNFNIRVFGSLSGSAGTTREILFNLKRISNNSVVSSGSLIETTSGDFQGRAITIGSYISGANDTFITEGFYIDFLNNSGATLTLSSIEVYINGVR